MRRILRSQRCHQSRILNLSIHEPQELGIDIIHIEPYLIYSLVRRRRSNGPPIASTIPNISPSIERSRKLLDLHATAVIAEVERQASIAPDILPRHCLRLCFDLYFVGMVVAPSGAVASTDRALAYVDVFGESGNCDCDGAAVAGGAD